MSDTVGSMDDHPRTMMAVVEFPGAQPINNAALLELDVDILGPAALENQITADNVERVRPRILAEIGNGPTTTDADVVLGY